MEISNVQCTFDHLNFCIYYFLVVLCAQRQRRYDALMMIHFVNENNLNIGMCSKYIICSMGIMLTIVLRKWQKEVITIMIITKVLNKEDSKWV